MTDLQPEASQPGYGYSARLLRRFARWGRMIDRLAEQHPQVRAAFRERRRLGWIDVEALSRLPEGTLGRVFADPLRANGLEPNLVDVPVEDDASYFLAHAFETHGCGNDEPGEFAVAGFYAAQTEAPFQLRELMEGLARGFLAGRQARPLFGTDWAAPWDVPIENVRKGLGIDPHPLYAARGIQEAA